jgi:hypothetical protein
MSFSGMEIVYDYFFFFGILFIFDRTRTKSDFNPDFSSPPHDCDIPEIMELTRTYQDLFGGRKIYTYSFICYQCRIRPRCFESLFDTPSERRKFFRGLKACRKGRDPGVSGNQRLLTVWRLYEFIKKIEILENQGIRLSLSDSVGLVFLFFFFVYIIYTYIRLIIFWKNLKHPWKKNIS